MNTLKKLFFTLCAGILAANSMEAAIVDTLLIKSNKMNRYIETVVIIPNQAAQMPSLRFICCTGTAEMRKAGSPSNRNCRKWPTVTA